MRQTWCGVKLLIAEFISRQLYNLRLFYCCVPPTLSLSYSCAYLTVNINNEQATIPGIAMLGYVRLGYARAVQAA